MITALPPICYKKNLALSNSSQQVIGFSQDDPAFNKKVSKQPQAQAWANVHRLLVKTPGFHFV